jgi:hypothetical protein
LLSTIAEAVKYEASICTRCQQRENSDERPIKTLP